MDKAAFKRLEAYCERARQSKTVVIERALSKRIDLYENMVKFIELMTNYALGRWIVEEQQNGQDRAQYGARVIDRLSEALTEEFGRGYSRETLKNCRRFYLEYKDRIGQTLFTLFAIEKSKTLFTQFKEKPPFTLPWSHYLILMRIKDENERKFYEIDTI